MTRFISRLAADLEPYVPGEQPKDKKYVKLNTNESPFPPSKKVLEAVTAAAEDLRLYPDPDATAVRQAAADYYNRKLNLQGSDALDAENVFVGNGSDEVLAFLFPAFFKGKKIAFADITYSFYPVYCAFYEIPYQLLPLRDNFTIDLDQYAGGLAEEIQGLLICNPNAPTGIGLGLSEIEQILQANPDRLVIVDEAYVDFGGETVVGLINRYDNLLVAQTLSKSRQLAGMRVGLAFGCHELIEAVNRVKNSFNSYSADRLGIAAAKAALEDEAYFEQTRKQIMQTRKRTVKALEELGFDVLPSSTNFIFVKPPEGVAASDLFSQLRVDGILVRYFAKPRIDGWLRITIGTDEEMDIMLDAVRKRI